MITVFLGAKIAGAQGPYIEYHKLVNQGNQYWYEKEYQLALEHYLDGFELVSYVHNINYVKPARTAAKLQQYDLVQQFITKALKGGYPASILEKKEFNKFKKTEQYRLSFL